MFDITQTNIGNRRQHVNDGTISQKERSQQSNLETLLQVVGLRSQPENITKPEIVDTPRELWGMQIKKKTLKAWSFTFTVNYKSIFTCDDDDLGHLKGDCSGVPMIIGLDESTSLIPKLDCGREYKNIHFEVLDEDN